jgi:plasmid stabilization system protein ParE
VKRYQVIVTPDAETSIKKSFLDIFASSPLNAERWLRRLYAEIDTLQAFPERCAFALEREYFEMDLRQLLFKSHRVVFSVDRPKSKVRVHEVRHLKRKALGGPVSEDEE